MIADGATIIESRSWRHSLGALHEPQHGALRQAALLHLHVNNAQASHIYVFQPRMW
jgi:hypothetical protein